MELVSKTFGELRVACLCGNDTFWAMGMRAITNYDELDEYQKAALCGPFTFEIICPDCFREIPGTRFNLEAVVGREAAEEHIARMTEDAANA